jgi:hypothetical protein
MRQQWKMIKREETKEDGRRIIYYSFSPQARGGKEEWERFERVNDEE